MNNNVIKNTEKLTNSQVEQLLNIIGLFEDVELAYTKQLIDKTLYDKLCNTIAKYLKPFSNHPETKLLIENIGRKYPVLKFDIDRAD